MALTDQERKILEYGKQNGKSRTEVLEALSKYRGAQAAEKEVGLAQGSVQGMAEGRNLVGFNTGFIPNKETLGDIKETGGRIFGEFRQAGENIVETATDKDLTLGEKVRGIGSEVFRRPARAFGEAVLGLGKAALPQRTEEAIASKTQEVAQDVIDTEPVQNTIAVYESLPDDAKREVDNALGFAEGLAEILGVGAARRVAPQALKNTKVVVEATKDMVEDGVDLAVRTRRLNKIIDSRNQVDDAVGQIIQGEVADRPAALRALGDIDTTNISTYQELSDTFGDRISVLSRELDDFLGEQDTIVRPQDITTTTKVGDELISQNFVEDALSHLDEMYDKVGEPAKRAEINQLRTKFETEGLTPLELNNLAREYGVQFKRKAFSKKGDALTSVNAQKYENTRRGVKDAVRGTIEGDVPREIDAKISDLYSTRALSDDMLKKVNRLQQKVEERGLLQRIARLTGKAVNAATFRTPEGFLTAFIPSNVGNKTLNSLDLQEALSKNLQLVDTALNTTDDEVIVNALVEIIRSTQESQ